MSGLQEARGSGDGDIGDLESGNAAPGGWLERGGGRGSSDGPRCTRRKAIFLGKVSPHTWMLCVQSAYHTESDSMGQFLPW